MGGVEDIFSQVTSVILLRETNVVTVGAEACRKVDVEESPTWVAANEGSGTAMVVVGSARTDVCGNTAVVRGWHCLETDRGTHLSWSQSLPPSMPSTS